jgi:hypothetical protein
MGADTSKQSEKDDVVPRDVWPAALFRKSRQVLESLRDPGLVPSKPYQDNQGRTPVSPIDGWNPFGSGRRDVAAAIVLATDGVMLKPLAEIISLMAVDVRTLTPFYVGQRLLMRVDGICHLCRKQCRDALYPGLRKALGPSHNISNGSNGWWSEAVVCSLLSRPFRNAQVGAANHPASVSRHHFALKPDLGTGFTPPVLEAVDRPPFYRDRSTAEYPDNLDNPATPAIGGVTNRPMPAATAAAAAVVVDRDTGVASVGACGGSGLWVDPGDSSALGVRSGRNGDAGFPGQGYEGGDGDAGLHLAECVSERWLELHIEHPRSRHWVRVDSARLSRKHGRGNGNVEGSKSRLMPMTPANCARLGIPLSPLWSWIAGNPETYRSAKLRDAMLSNSRLKPRSGLLLPFDGPSWTFAVGEFYDVSDLNDRWYAARLAEMAWFPDGPFLRFQFLADDDSDWSDEWLPAESHRIAPFGSCADLNSEITASPLVVPARTIVSGRVSFAGDPWSPSHCEFLRLRLPRGSCAAFIQSDADRVAESFRPDDSCPMATFFQPGVNADDRRLEATNSGFVRRLSANVKLEASPQTKRTTEIGRADLRAANAVLGLLFYQPSRAQVDRSLEAPLTLQADGSWLGEAAIGSVRVLTGDRLLAYLAFDPNPPPHPPRPPPHAAAAAAAAVATASAAVVETGIGGASDGWRVRVELSFQFVTCTRTPLGVCSAVRFPILQPSPFSSFTTRNSSNPKAIDALGP